MTINGMHRDRCPMCESSSIVALRGQSRARSTTAETYRQCGDCRHSWLYPSPTEARLAAYYNAQYAVPADRHATRAAAAARALRRLLASRTSGRLLEVGCSYGDVMAAFVAEGWETVGVELDTRAASAARARGLDVRAGTVDAMVRPGERFDVVYASHVIEHVPAPDALVARLVAALKPDGVLVMRTPNVSSLAARCIGGRWEWAAIPEHVHLFSPASVQRLLARHGLARIRLLTRRGDAHPILLELPLALARRIRRRGAGGGAHARSSVQADNIQGRSVPWTHQPWFMHAARTVGALEVPLDAVLSSAGLGEELVVVASRG